MAQVRISDRMDKDALKEALLRLNIMHESEVQRIRKVLKMLGDRRCLRFDESRTPKVETVPTMKRYREFALASGFGLTDDMAREHLAKTYPWLRPDEIV